jgi:undecaprenyl diphosphate synthase
MNKKGKEGLHIGIIPDGSRRWSRKNDIFDWRAPGEAVDKLVRNLFFNYPEVSEISIWALSTENLDRNTKDKNLVYAVINNKIKDLIKFTRGKGKESLRIRVIGSRWGELPKHVKETALEAVEESKNNTGPVLNLCIGYGGKEEILEAAMASSKWFRKNPTIAKMHKNVFEKFLLVPKPLDMVIRTGGERRLSGFMLYQIEYAELFFSDTLWPDFSTQELDNIMEKFRERERRFGK